MDTQSVGSQTPDTGFPKHELTIKQVKKVKVTREHNLANRSRKVEVAIAVDCDESTARKLEEMDKVVMGWSLTLTATAQQSEMKIQDIGKESDKPAAKKASKKPVAK